MMGNGSIDFIKQASDTPAYSNTFENYL